MALRRSASSNRRLGKGISSGFSSRSNEQWATTVGPNTLAAITAIQASRKVVEQSYGFCMGVMSLAKRSGGMARLEDTCTRALAATPAPSYTLIKKLWTGWEPAPPQPAASLGVAGFVRGADYYGGQA